MKTILAVPDSNWFAHVSRTLEITNELRKMDLTLYLLEGFL